MGVDSCKSSLTITGGITDWFINQITKLFKPLILKELIKEAESVVSNLVHTTVNEDLKKYGSHFDVDGVGFDFAQIRTPIVSEDLTASMFVNGTFYEETTQKLGKVIPTEHTSFEIGNISRRDLMFHMPRKTAESFVLNLLNAPDGFKVTEILRSAPFNQHYTVSQFCQFNKLFCVSDEWKDQQGDVVLFFDNARDLSFANDSLGFISDLRWKFFSNNTLLADYTLFNTSVFINVESKVKQAQLYIEMNTLNFTHAKINQQGAIPITDVSLIDGASHNLQDFQNFWNNNYANWDNTNLRFNRFRYISSMQSVFFFKEAEIKLHHDILFVGLTFDDLYLGRPQDM